MSEIAKGYKKTEVGVIPEDWEVKELGEIILKTKLGGNYSNTEKDTGLPLIKMGNISRGNINLNKIEYIKDESEINKDDILNYGDVLFNTRNTLELVGKVAIWKNELSIAFYNSNLLRMEFKKNIIASNFYMNYIFNNQNSIKQLKGFAIGTTSVAAIYNRDLYKMLIPIPPLQEQTAIAEALSDVDSLISSLEKLIDKKKRIKEGAMQELLTGKKRLDGFSGEWEVKRLGEIGKTYGGLSAKVKSDFDNGNKPYIPFMNVMKNTVIDKNFLNYVKIKTNEYQNKILKGDLIFNGSSETPEEVGMSSYLNDDIPDLYLNSFCFSFRLILEIEINGLYLSYFFRSEYGRKIFSNLAQGATRYNLSKNNFMNIRFKLPPTKEEQTAIAEILSDMDSEIVSLETKLEKYRQIKQGMMQELLTGRIRLV